MNIGLYPALSKYLTPEAFQFLLVLLQRLRPVIDTALANRGNRDRLLPTDVASFLCAAIRIDASTLSDCWTILLPHIDSLGEAIDYHREADDLFRTYGAQFAVG